MARQIQIIYIQPWHRRSLLLFRVRRIRLGLRSPDRGAHREAVAADHGRDHERRADDLRTARPRDEDHDS